MNKEQAMQEWKDRVVAAAVKLVAQDGPNTFGWIAAERKLSEAVAAQPDPLRGTGRTTTVAMEMLATAMRSPGFDVRGRDHIGGNVQALVGKVAGIARGLGVSYKVEAKGNFAVVRVYPPNTSAEAP